MLKTEDNIHPHRNEFTSNVGMCRTVTYCIYEPYFLNLNLITVNYKLIVDYNFIHIVRLYYEIKISLPKEICYNRLERGGGGEE